MDNQVFSFEVSVKGRDWAKIVNARTAGRAKHDYYRDLMESWPNIPYTALRCRKLGAPQTSAQFVRNAEYRGMPDIKCGTRVLVGTEKGTIVGHNSSANFDVLFDEDSPKYHGMTLNVHPSSVVVTT